METKVIKLKISNSRRILVLLFSNAIIINILISCTTDELCYSHPHEGDITILYDWAFSPDASEEVKEMRVNIYDSKGERVTFKDIPYLGSHLYDIVDGNYSIITHNHSNGKLRFSYDETYSSYFAYTENADLLSGMPGRTISSSLRSSTGEPVRYSIDRLWADNSDSEIFENGAVITFTPRPLYCHYSFEVKNVEGSFSHIVYVSASISGMSHSITIKDRKLSNETSTLPLEAQINVESKLISGEFYTFGHNDDIESKHYMEFYLIMDDGKGYRFSGRENLDVTDQVHSAIDIRNVHLVIDGLKIPTVISNGSGFDVGLDDWDNEWINVDL